LESVSEGGSITLLLDSTERNVQDSSNNSNVYKSDKEYEQERGMRRREGEEIEWENLDCVLPAENRNHWRALCAVNEKMQIIFSLTYLSE
jgi:hypothetical protein